MTFLFLILLSQLTFATSSENENGFKELNDCVTQLNAQAEMMGKGVRHWASYFQFQMEPGLELIEGFEQTVAWSEKKRRSQDVKSLNPHLIGNAYIACLELQRELELQVKKLDRFLYSIILFGSFFILGLGFLLRMVFRKYLNRMAFIKQTNPEMNSDFKKRVLIWIAFSVLFNKSGVADLLNVYTYDALTGKSSFGEILKREFEKKTGSQLILTSLGSSGEALNQIVIEGSKSKADILLGVDSSFADRARATQLFSPVSVQYFFKLEPNLTLGKDRLFLPFDYGFLAFLYNRDKLHKKPSEFSGMTLSKFLESEQIRKKIVIEDPRTSSIGFSFLRWTQESFKSNEALKTVWEKFIPKLVTVAPSWSGAYGLFLKGEAEWVLSYTTSRAYHLEKEKKDQYEVLIFEDGHGLQIEAAAVLKHSKKKELINSFLELLVSEEIQKELPLTQWMYPARVGTLLPQSFKGIPIPKAISLSGELSERERKKLVNDWTRWASTSP